MNQTFKRLINAIGKKKKAELENVSLRLAFSDQLSTSFVKHEDLQFLFQKEKPVAPIVYHDFY